MKTTVAILITFLLSACSGDQRADPRSVDPVEIRNIKVLTTLIGGEVVFRASGAWAK